MGHPSMSKFTIISDKAIDLVGQAGSSMKHMVPSASKLLQTGVAVGAMKTGGRVALAFVRRNPVVAVAAAVGVGVVAYAASRRRKLEEAANPIEGRSRRVDAKRVGSASKRASAARPARKPRAGKGSSESSASETASSD